MSVNGSLSGITFGGLTSGIDTEGIISKLIQIESRPLQRIQTQQADLQSKQAVYAQLRTKVSGLSQAAANLNQDSTFNPISGTSSNNATALVSVGPGATAGTYALSVSKLAQAQKIASAPQSDTTTALNLSGGKVTVNGKVVTVDATDSLRSIAGKINGLNNGVTASIVDGGTGNAYLTIASTSTGAKNGVQMADLTGTTLSSLGITTGSAVIRTAVTNGARSFGFSSPTTTLGSMLNSGTVAAGSFTLNGSSVAVNWSTDTLQSIADKVNALGGGLGATVASTTKGTTTTYQLELTGTSTPTFGDPNNILAAIGVLQKAPGSQLIAAQDAEFKLDGVDFKSETNTNTTIIPGATLTLQQGNTTTNGVTSPSTTTISLSKDISQVKGKIAGFMTGYNNLVDFMNQYSQLDTKTFESGPLFSDSIASSVQSTLSNLLFTNVAGLTGAYKNLASVGFGLDKDGRMTLDDTQLTAALNADPTAVANLFQTTGTGSVPAISYVSSTAKSVPSGALSYNVNVTQVATKQSFVAGKLQTSANPTSEKLTFSGSLFGSSPYSLLLDVNSTASLTVSKINNDSKLKDLVYASLDISTGKLRIDSKRFGTGGNFTVVSNYSSSSSNSGIGVGGEGTTVAGVDVAGTINGESATGAGQFLSGNTGNAKTEGLQIQYTGSTTGSVGTISTSKGMGMMVSDLMATFTDSVYGAITANDKSLQTQIDGLTTDMTKMQTRLKEMQAELRTRFAAMESAISTSQSQSQRLGALKAR